METRQQALNCIAYYLRCQELEAEVQKLRAELEALRSRASTEGAASMTSSVAKVVQPTATVSSVPVCGPSKKTIIFLKNHCNILVFSYRYRAVSHSRARDTTNGNSPDVISRRKGKPTIEKN